jgi:molybdate transport system substrate-binding protein
MTSRRAAAFAILGLSPPARAAEMVQVLSGGALEPAVSAVLRLWRGGEVRVDFATAPNIAARLEAGETPDLVFAPQGLIDGLARGGRLVGPRVRLGAIGVGIAIRANAPDPMIRDEASFRTALLGADAVVFNRASTGLYVEGLLERLGLTTALDAKIVRYPDGDGVLRRIAGGSGREIAFAATTEILLFRDRGVRLAGPLPGALQNRTVYAAGLLATTDTALRLLSFLDSAPARQALAAAGVE